MATVEKERISTTARAGSPETIWVVFESMYGNTMWVAQAISEGLGGPGLVNLVEVGDAPATVPGHVRLLVVGGPTHAFGMSRPSTRQTALDEATGPLVSRRIGIREWLADLPKGQASVATFDTKMSHPRLPGGAARGADRRLRAKGFRRLRSPETFWVDGKAGPLAKGEVDRAAAWGAALATAMDLVGREGR